MFQYFIVFSSNENIRMAYGHPRSHSCGGLEGPFGPCWEPLASVLCPLSSVLCPQEKRVYSILSPQQTLSAYKALSKH